MQPDLIGTVSCWVFMDTSDAKMSSLTDMHPREQRFELQLPATCSVPLVAFYTSFIRSVVQLVVAGFDDSSAAHAQIVLDS